MTNSEFEHALIRLGDDGSIRASAWCVALDRCAGLEQGPWWDDVPEPVKLETDLGIGTNPFVDLAPEDLLLARRVAAEVIGGRGDHLSKGVLDPMCGGGVLVAALLEESGIELESVELIDPDPLAVVQARQRLCLIAGIQGWRDPVEGYAALAPRVHTADVAQWGGPTQADFFSSQAPDPVELLNDRFDVALVSPRPRSLSSTTRNLIRANLTAARGAFSYEIALIESTILSMPAGALGVFVVDPSHFYREYGRALITEIFERYKVEKLHYFDRPGVGDRLVICLERRPPVKCVLHTSRLEFVGDEWGEVEVETPESKRPLIDEIQALGLDAAARRLKFALDAQPVEETLGDLLTCTPGRSTVCGLIDLWRADSAVAEGLCRARLTSESIRAFSVDRTESILWPYERPGKPWQRLPDELERRLWPVKPTLRSRESFGKPIEEIGVWYEHLEHYPARLSGVRLAMPLYGRCVAAARLYGDETVSSSAMALSVESESDAYLALGILNSRFATFWTQTYAFSSPTGSVELTVRIVQSIPLPNRGRKEIIAISRRLDRVARSVVDGRGVSSRASTLEEVREMVAAANESNRQVLKQLDELRDELEEAVAMAYSLEEFESDLGAYPRETIRREIDTDRVVADLVHRTAMENYRARILFTSHDLATRLGCDPEWLRGHLSARAVEFNPSRYLNTAGIRRWLSWREVRQAQHRADVDGVSGPGPLEGLAEHEFASRSCLPDFSPGLSREHHWRHLGPWLSPSVGYYCLGDLGELVDADVFTLASTDPLEVLKIVEASVQWARTRAFYPPGRASVDDPRALGVLGVALAMEPSFGRLPPHDRQRWEAIASTILPKDSEMEDVLAAYSRWLRDGRSRPEATARPGQLDLARLAELEAYLRDALDGPLTLPKLADVFLKRGWAYVQTRAVLEALAAAGRVEADREGRWRVVTDR